MQVNVWDLVSQVIESRRVSLDLFREHLSNMCAAEVLRVIAILAPQPYDWLFNVIFQRRSILRCWKELPSRSAVNRGSVQNGASA